MTNEWPARSGFFAPLGSVVFPKSRIERYLDSFAAAALRGMTIGGAGAVPSALAHVVHVRRARDQWLVLHPDQAGDLRALARRDAARLPVHAQGPSVRDALQAA